MAVTILTEFGDAPFDANVTDDAGSEVVNKTRVIVISVFLGSIILSTIVGNVLVIAATVLERNLRNVANYLISSLAAADLMVAALVMPLAAVYEVSEVWFLGPIVCDMWISFDVLCCTSSILHLVAISVDRYWAVTQADYIHNRSSARILIMVGLSWGVSGAISVPPMFATRDPMHDPDKTGSCLISQDWTYTVFSTIGAFYLPLIVMTIIYLKIYDVAQSRIRKRQFRRSAAALSSASENSTTTVASKVVLLDEAHLISELTPSPIPPPPPFKSSSSPSPPTERHPLSRGGATVVCIAAEAVCETSSRVCILPRQTDDPTARYAPGPQSNPGGTYRWERLRQHLRKGINGSWITRSQDDQGADATSSSAAPTPTPVDDEATLAERKRRAKVKLEQKRERKAARTLAIITGTFVICWLPFFIVALVRPFCGSACYYPRILVSIIGWLGYVNSLLNPVIYTIFNPDFRSAFRKIIFGKYRHHSAQNSRITMRLLRR